MRHAVGGPRAVSGLVALFDRKSAEVRPHEVDLVAGIASDLEQVTLAGVSGKVARCFG
jgi:hypothetical protein